MRGGQKMSYIWLQGGWKRWGFSLLHYSLFSITLLLSPISRSRILATFFCAVGNSKKLVLGFRLGFRAGGRLEKRDCAKALWVSHTLRSWPKPAFWLVDNEKRHYCDRQQNRINNKKICTGSAKLKQNLNFHFLCIISIGLTKQFSGLRAILLLLPSARINRLPLHSNFKMSCS